MTVTLPKPEDMRLELSLDVMLEGSLGDLPNTVNAEEAREREHQIPEERPQATPLETLMEGSPERKSKGNVREAPRRIQRTREASREDAIASTHQFFAAVHERNRDTAAEEPIVTSSDQNENNVTIPSNIPATPDIPEAEVTETETRSPKLSYLVGLLLDLLLQLPVDLGLGYNAFQRDKSMNLPKRIHVHQRVV